MRILFATGGTGGHIYPALALAKRLQHKHEILFVGSDDRMEKTIIPQHGFAFEAMKITSYEGNVIQRIQALTSVAKCMVVARKIIKQFKPDLVMGFGGYISLPLLLVAQKMNIKTMIHEQNSIMGKTNQLVYKKTDGVIVCYKNLLNEYKDAKVRLLGNPRASEIITAYDDE